jgi:hypothetical protein
MAGKSNYLEGRVLDHLYGAVASTAPATIYVGLFTAAPTDAGGGTEVTGGSYARAAVTNNATNWPAASGTPRMKSNGTVIAFAAPTAAWGTVTHFATFDAATAGNMFHWAALTTPRTIASGDGAPNFAAGALDITED